MSSRSENWLSLRTEQGILVSYCAGLFSASCSSIIFFSHSPSSLFLSLRLPFSLSFLRIDVRQHYYLPHYYLWGHVLYLPSLQLPVTLLDFKIIVAPDFWWLSTTTWPLPLMGPTGHQFMKWAQLFDPYHRHWPTSLSPAHSWWLWWVICPLKYFMEHNLVVDFLALHNISTPACPLFSSIFALSLPPAGPTQAFLTYWELAIIFPGF